jgi:hypothetical protein
MARAAKKPVSPTRSQPLANRLEQQRAIAFDYHELLTAIVRDLENLDRLIPPESSRHPFVSKMGDNARYLIVARKDDLLGYIQTICRDHIEWGRKRLTAGWTPEQERRNKRKA